MSNLKWTWIETLIEIRITRITQKNWINLIKDKNRRIQESKSTRIEEHKNRRIEEHKNRKIEESFRENLPLSFQVAMHAWHAVKNFNNQG